MRDHATPLCIILINSCLLVLIDMMCLLENFETHSLYQRAVLRKSIVYLSLNMLFIPAISLSSSFGAMKVQSSNSV
jgi:hypothetical protein